MNTGKLIYLLYLTVALLFQTSTIAQQFEVAPVKLNYTLEAGQSSSSDIYITNKANVEQSFSITLGDWMPDENGSIVTFEAGTVKRSCANWISISKNYITLKPNETQKVSLSMFVPENENTTKWAYVYIENVEETTDAINADKSLQMGIKITGRIAIKVFQSPKSNTSYSGGISDFKEEVNDKSNKRSFSANIFNNGDKILDCKVHMVISNMETAKEMNLDPVSYNLLPNMAKTIIIELPDNLKKGKYSIAAILDYKDDADLEGQQLEIEIK